MEQRFKVTVTDVSIIAHEIRQLVLSRPAGGDFPAYEPGAHIDVFLPDGTARQYSLVDPDKRGQLRIAVAREPDGRGGSAHLHDGIAAGDVIEIGAPRCHFPLVPDAPASVLFAGGIGVTPIWCMAQTLEAAGMAWTMHFAARTRGHAALLNDIEAAGGERVKTYFNLEGDPLIDFAAVIASAPEGVHFYCCGPNPMIEAFREACRNIPASRVHFEQFSATEEAARDGGFEVELAKSGKSVRVEEGETILDALKRIGVHMSFSCREGICGSCETNVIAGKPDHRDAVLTDDEKAESKTMMICCSGSIGDKLVLDL